MDLRNNLILVERYLPRELRRPYRRDWLQRYARFALHDGNKEAVESGLREARVWGRREAAVGRRTLDSMTVEHLFDLKRQAMVVAKWQRENKVRRVVLVDFSKNLFATWRACQAASMESVALADDRPAFEGRRYRGVPIFDIPTAVGLAPDGAVITNINPGQIDARERAVRRAFRGPVLRLWEPAYLNPSREAKSDAA
jgi:hypothetical protein